MTLSEVLPTYKKDNESHKKFGQLRLLPIFICSSSNSFLAGSTCPNAHTGSFHGLL